MIFLMPIPIHTGKKVPPPKPSAPNPDYVQCPVCKRRFQEHAAERHIPFCKEQSSRIERKNISTSTHTASLNKRLSYKAPTIKKRVENEKTDHHHVCGSSVVQKRANFSSTHTIHRNDYGTDNHSPGKCQLT